MLFHIISGFILKIKQKNQAKVPILYQPFADFAPTAIVGSYSMN
jgi:hypothetical protein